MLGYILVQFSRNLPDKRNSNCIVITEKVEFYTSWYQEYVNSPTLWSHLVSQSSICSHRTRTVSIIRVNKTDGWTERKFRLNLGINRLSNLTLKFLLFSLSQIFYYNYHHFGLFWTRGTLVFLICFSSSGVAGIWKKEDQL